MTKPFEPRWLYKKDSPAVLVSTQDEFNAAKEDGYGEHEHVAQAKAAALKAVGGDTDALKAAEERINQLESEAVSTDGRIKELESIVENGKRQIEDLNSRKEEVEKELGDEKRENASLKDDIATLRNQLQIAGGKTVPIVPPEGKTTNVPILEATDEAEALAAEKGIDLKTVTGTGAAGKITKGDVAKAIKDQGK